MTSIPTCIGNRFVRLYWRLAPAAAQVQPRPRLQRHGWTTDALRSYITDVGFVQERVQRMMGNTPPPPRPQFPPGDPTGVLRFRAKVMSDKAC